MPPFIASATPLNVCRVIVVSLLLGGLSDSASAQMDFEREPINYGKTPTHDAVVKLQSLLDSGKGELNFDEEHGYLKSVLQSLGIKPSSQVLVHSKTSFQLRRISPRHPRALYFNDESYVGWVQGGDVIEVMTTDPQQGEVFYTLSQEKSERPQFVRDRGQCIICHASSRTQAVPGGLVRSMFVDASGQPKYGSGTFNSDHHSPLENRWGGWYVTGTHGKMRHMGNVVSQSRLDSEEIDREAGANVTDLSDRFNVKPYLTPHSDLVALMVLEHQLQMHNYITAANFENRSATHSDGIMNAALDRPSDYVSDTTKRRVASAGDKLLRYLLFSEEFQLTSPVKGTSALCRRFSSARPAGQKRAVSSRSGFANSAAEISVQLFDLFPCVRWSAA